MMRDADFGIVRVRAFGTFDFRISDPKLFLKEVAGSDHNFRLDEFNDTMRSRLVSVFNGLATAKIPVLDLATRYQEIGDALLPLINPLVNAKCGLAIESFILENASVPPEVEAAIDKRSSMSAIGNLNDYVKFQMAEGMAKGGGSAAAAELAVGMAIAQQMIKDQGGFVPGAGTPAPAGATAPPPVPPGSTADASRRGQGPRRHRGRRHGQHRSRRSQGQEDRRRLPAHPAALDHSSPTRPAPR